MLLSLILCLLFCTLTCFADIAWSINTTSGLKLVVNDDDSYSLSIIGGDTWLISGKHGFHSNGIWYLLNATNSSNTTCSSYQDTDCRGSDITYINSTTSESVCCAACAATPGCNAWTLTGDTVTSVPWANRCYLKTDCSGKQEYTGHVSGIINTPISPLVRVTAAPISGSDSILGSYTGYEISYTGNAIPFLISFKYYTSIDSLIFEHSFPIGASNLNVTSVVNTTSSSSLLNVEFSASTIPSTAFPVWLPAATSDASTLGSATWAGRFASSVVSTNGGVAYALNNLCNFGAEGGPLVLWDRKNTSIGTGDTLVLGPLFNFKGSIMGKGIQDNSCAAGLNGYVVNAPSGLQSSILITFSKNGITDSMHTYGSILQQKYQTKKITDPMSTELSYWTDNGAYYDWYAYEPDITSKGVPQDVLTSLFDTFRNGSYSTTLPVKHVMLDAYWMNNLRPDGNCKVNDSFWTLPFPRPEMLSSELGGAGVILYNGPQCAETSYAEDWPLVYSLYWNQGWGSGTLSEIAGVNSSAFYTSLFSKLSTITNLTGFTQDFLDFHHLLFPAFLEDAKGNDAWQSGQAEAALNAHLPVQYCMAEPSDLLNSVRFNAVTNARASQDYGAGSGSSWRIASTSLLLSAIGLRASKDNFWSGSSSTDRGREPSPFLSGVVTALSHGPVGFADKIFEANPNVLLPTINQLGTILHASRPASWLDAQWHGVGPLAQGDVRLTHSVISEFLFYSLLAVELGKGIVSSSLTLNDLYPLPSASLTYAMWQYNNSACFTLNSPASQCITTVGGPFNGNLIPAPPVPDETLWELWSLSPILSNGKIFLGEYRKFVAVSPNRFLNLQVLNSQVCLDIVGAPNEMLTISWISNEVIGMKDIVLQKDGTLTSCF